VLSQSILSQDPLHRLKRIHVLVVDNDPAMIDLLYNVLGTLGFGNLHRARDGFEAVEIMKKHKIDLLITDWDLHPVQHHGIKELPANKVIVADEWSTDPVNGATFLKFLRGSRRSPNPYLAVIMLTGAALRENVAYARDSGVNEIIVKPITAEALCQRILMVVENDRPFITSKNYKGPCRRRVSSLRPDEPERRKADIRVIKYNG